MSCGEDDLRVVGYGKVHFLPVFFFFHTGGLVDTVANYDETTGEGTGFMFGDLHPESLANTIGWAVSTWYDRPGHIDAMRRRAMTQDFSWERTDLVFAQGRRVTCEDLLKAADEAMYHVKEHGKNGIYIAGSGSEDGS